MNIIGLIPIKYDYEGFSGLGLSMTANKTLIRIVYERAKKSSLFKEVYIVSDNETILKHAQTFKANTLKLDSDFTNHSQAVIDGYAKLKKKEESEIDAVMQIHFNEPQIDINHFESLYKKYSDDSIVCLAYKTVENDNKSDFGVLTASLNQNDEITIFVSKPDDSSISLPGTKLFGHKILNQILDQKICEDENQLFNDCIKQKTPVYIYRTDTNRLQIFTFNDLVKLG
ncbi:MAG: hypothetical protein JEZ03_12130 [Bacteroidales bacterium]|nr:hypothetical protein [Bacteroidales bacterium]